MNISSDKLKSVGEDVYDDGYRIVYFYSNGEYKLGSYSGLIEGFMYDFIECAPIFDEDDIPKFISIDDLLNRYLEKSKDRTSVAIYRVDGTVVSKKVR